jgi:ATP/ADP translocase
MSLLQSCKQELSSLKTQEKWFVFYAMLLGFCISSEYAITRPASHALFLTVFTSNLIPWLWLATVPVNLLIIFLYNRFLPALGPIRMWGILSCGIMLVNGLTGLFFGTFPEIIFFQCIWKDIYILLMFKQMWSMIHVTIAANRAKYLYGMIFATGTIGSCVGSCVPSFFATDIGSETLFFFTLPAYLILLTIYRAAWNKSLLPEHPWTRAAIENPSPTEGFSLVSKNRLLLAILLLVIAMQVSSGFMEFRFNAYLEQSILDKDLRTAYCGQLFGLTNILSMVLQGFGSFLLIHWMGLRKTHFLIPYVLLGSAICTWMVPSFGWISLSYVLLKAIDFSLFSVGREMLYIPFDLDEKFRAKAVIDVFAYRSSKALVSLSILSLQAIAGLYLLELASYVSIAVFVLWILVVFFMLHPAPIRRNI